MERGALIAGLDIGTTHLSATVYRLDDRIAPVVSVQCSNSAATHTGERAELDLAVLYELVTGLLRQLAERLGEAVGQLEALGVTGQQHSVALVGYDGIPRGPAITWQDRRVLAVDDEGDTSLERFISRAGGLAAFTAMGCRPATGYAGPSIYWLKETGQLPRRVWACLIPDAIVAHLTDSTPCSDPTLAGSSGLFDIVRSEWAWPVIDRLGLERGLFVRPAASGERAGALAPNLANATGLLQGLPIATAMGDNQASFLGSVRQPQESILLNVGTGAQCSAQIDAFTRMEGLDTRAYLEGAFLLVGAGLFGGRSYAYLQSFYQLVGQQLLGLQDCTELYERMNQLAAAVPPRCDGLRCIPLFSGTRSHPELRASLSGISPDNLTPGHLTRALLEGIAELFYGMADTMQPITGARRVLVGSGNGIRLNPVFGEILSSRFGLPLVLPGLREEASLGAALCAGVSAGLIVGWDAASALVQHDAPDR